MKHRRKGQASMEFLLTYAWAALIVIVVAAALAYFGVIGIDRYPSACIFPAGADCVDKAAIVKGSPGNITIAIRNNLGNINITNRFSASACAETTILSVNGRNDFPITVNKDELAVIVIPCTTQKIKFKSDIAIYYENLDSGLENQFKGQVTGISG